MLKKLQVLTSITECSIACMKISALVSTLYAHFTKMHPHALVFLFVGKADFPS